GTARTTALTDELVSIARRCITAVDSLPVYARVDVARLDGEWVLMERELVEPELFFRLDPRLADGLAELLLLAPWRPAACHTDRMADTDMTDAERDAFLSDVRVGILAIERDGKGPL